MKKLLVLTSALLVLTASMASAQINLAWKNCLGTGIGVNTAVANLNYACDESLAGIPQRWVLSFVSPGNYNNYVGMQAEIATQTADPTLPDFWKLGVGECREGTLVYPAGFTGVGNTTCVNPYTSQTGGGYQWTSGYGSPARGRLQLAFADANERILTAGRHYIGSVGTLDLTMDLGFGACAGCEVPACLVVTSMELYQTAGSPPQDVIPLTLTGATRYWISWQGGAIDPQDPNACPNATPTKKATWGSVKSLYR